MLNTNQNIKQKAIWDLDKLQLKLKGILKMTGKTLSLDILDISYVLYFIREKNKIGYKILETPIFLQIFKSIIINWE